MSKNKNGVELSMNTMIIAVLAVLVLVIVVFILIKGSGNFMTASQCEAHNGICVALTTKCPPSTMPSAFNCKDKYNPKCCMDVEGYTDDITGT